MNDQENQRIFELYKRHNRSVVATKSHCEYSRGAIERIIWAHIVKTQGYAEAQLELKRMRREQSQDRKAEKRQHLRLVHSA